MKKVIEKFKPGDVEIPECVVNQNYKFYILAVSTFVLGLIMAVLLKSIYILLSITILSVVLVAMGYYRYFYISHHGLMEIEGDCERIEYTLVSRYGGKATKDIPKCYLVRSNDKIYSVPYSKHNPTLREGDKIRFYVKDEGFVWNKIYYPSVIYGYEIISYNYEEDSE